MGPKIRILKAQDKAARAIERRKMGRLGDLVVAPVTLNRYRTSLGRFFLWVTAMMFTLPNDAINLDFLLTEYIEYLWQEGDPVGWGNDLVSGFQHEIPHLKRQLVGAWRLLKAWTRLELPNRAAPLPPIGVLGFVGLSLLMGWQDLAVLIGLGFLGFLRTGELFNLKKDDITIKGSRILITLAGTKTSVRKKANELSSVVSPWISRLLVKHLKNLEPGQRLLRRSPANARLLFKHIVEFFKLDQFNFQFYSLRRGGASWDFRLHGSMERTLLNGRWESVSTARVYVNDALASSVLVKMTEESRLLLTQVAVLAKRTY
jgi:hypothetical protein